ncbi:MAG: glycosyltransferase [Oscillospiraceae bacterium]
MQKLTIIIPVYNAEKYLRRCISSIIEQDYPNLELILVNDGSTDNSFSIMREFPAIILDKQNGGAASARNEGLRYATGDFIMFVDSDDSLAPGCLKNIMNAKTDITRFKMRYCYPDSTTFIEPKDFESGRIIPYNEFKNTVYPKMFTSTKMNTISRTLYKRNVIKDIMFNEKMKTAEDLAFNIEAFSNAKTFEYIDKPYYNYSKNNEGLSGKGTKIWIKYKCNFIITKKLLGHLKLWHMNNLKYIFLALIRPFTVTILKILRKR